MAGTIFINYRRDDSIGMAGRLHDRLAQTFGRDKLFMDVDHIPVGVDFVEHLNSQVAACDAILVVIGPHWLDAKDESGDRRLDNPDDFVAIEIAAALARDIRVIPVLVDGARIPKASQLPDSLKPLARRHAAEVRHSHFGHDAEALVERMREALGEEVLVAREREAPRDKAAGPGWWRVRTVVGVAAVAVLLLIGVGGYTLVGKLVQRGVPMADANRKVEEVERQRLADLKAEEGRRAAAEADAKRKAEEKGRVKGASEVEAKPKAEPSILVINDYSIRSVAFGPDGHTALSGSDNKKLKLWDLSSGQEIRTFTGHTDRVTSVAFARDGGTALSGSDDKTLKLWDVASGREIRTFTHSGPVYSVAFAPDGRTALTGHSITEVTLWDVASGRKIRTIRSNDWVKSVAFGPDGRNLLYASPASAVLVDVAEGEIIRGVGKGAHSAYLNSVVFAPDGRTALTASQDTTLKLWDLSNGREIRTFTGHSAGVTSVAFAPDGRTALSGSSDKTLKLWDVASGREIRTLTGHSDAVTSVAFAPDGRRALSGSTDDTLRLWDLTSLK